MFGGLKASLTCLEARPEVRGRGAGEAEQGYSLWKYKGTSTA